MIEIKDGGVEFALHICGCILTEAEIDDLFELPHIWEISSANPRWEKVIFHLDSIYKLTPERIVQAQDGIKAMLSRHRDCLVVS